MIFTYLLIKNLFFNRKSAEVTMDGEKSSLREQLVTVKEALNKSILAKEIMEAEKSEVVEALAKV